ncbi:MAG: hypothetical protein HKN99_02540 [Winogradskyella sp.]|nr:hypothetical protein [Winogradskyella sp.]NNC44738.1 hypothetical protein [Winogradskyella sp.]NNF86158.1 hypothetical protein [Winogradskyella sp.]NNL81878.1 hypothetical protein [Winogradskyella sp.]
MKRFIFLVLVMLSVLGCKNLENKDNAYAYLGGEIINPKNDVVILYDPKGKISDTISLDSENRFLHKIDSFETGVYSIRHGGEYQIVLLEPKDSILFRLNTYDFDESLVFTGEGARKNNYLLRIFLENELESKKLMEYSQLEPEAFDQFINERRLKQLDRFREFTSKKDVSPYCTSIIEANINYNNYADKEIYPFAYFGENKLIHVKDLPEGFYDHRKEIDYNAVDLSQFFSYNRFMFSHIDNLALTDFYQKNDFHSKFNRHDLDYNKAKLDIIDSLITEPSIKNNLYKYKTRDFISHNHSEEETNQFLEYFLMKSSNTADKDYMRDMVTSLNNLRPGKTLPVLEVLDVNTNKHDLNTLISKPTLIYFWSSNHKMQYRNSHYRVNELKVEFPNVDFVSINLNDNDLDYWKSILNQYKFPIENEYIFKNPRIARKVLAINYVNKVIVVDEDAIILHPNVNIYDTQFEDDLKQLLQKKELPL